MRTDGQTGRYDEAASSFVQLCECAYKVHSLQANLCSKELTNLQYAGSSLKIRPSLRGFTKFPAFKKPEGSLPCSLRPTTEHTPATVQYSPHFQTLFTPTPLPRHIYDVHLARSIS